MTDTQKVFSLSTVSGAQSRDYIEQAPNYGWTWPKKSWLAERLQVVRADGRINRIRAVGNGNKS